MLTYKDKERIFKVVDGKKIATVHTTSVIDDEILAEIYDKDYRMVGFSTYNDGGVTCSFIYIFQKIEHGETSAVEPLKPSKKNVFNFRSSMISLGVTEQVVDDWINVRKMKKASLTQTVFDGTKSNIIQIMEKYGITADDVVRIAVERNWQGIRFSYYQNIDFSEYGITGGQGTLFPMQNNTNTNTKKNDWQ